MDTIVTFFYMLAGVLLRLAIPIAATILVVFILRKLDKRWQAEAKFQPVRVEKPACWKIKGCTPEQMKNCSAVKSPLPGGRSVTEIARPGRGLADIRAAADQTSDAMRRGDDVIFQATLFDGRWLGYADFLLRVDRPSVLGSWSYEVADTKLARAVKGGAVLQVCVYSDLLGSSGPCPVVDPCRHR